MDDLSLVTSKMNIGKAGEYFLASQLLRHGYNAMPLPVDVGVDILAHRYQENEEHFVYQFQVKTTGKNEYRTQFQSSKLESMWRFGINLMVVFWSKNDLPSTVVIPPSLIYMLTSGGYKDPKAPLYLTNKNVNFRCFRKNERYYLRNKKNDITAMLNRIDRIEPVDSDSKMIPPYAYWSDDEDTLIEFDD